MFTRGLIKIRGRSIHSLDALTDDQVVLVFRSILDDARKNKSVASENDQLEFKQQLNLEDEDELRKDFAAFANTAGGLLIVGVDKSVAVKGIHDRIDDDRLRQVLSAKTWVQPPPEYSARTIVDSGKCIVLFGIRRSPVPVKVRRRGTWRTFCRYGGTVRDISPDEFMQRFHPGVWKTPERFKMSPETLGVYDLEGNRTSSVVRWSIGNQRRLFEWLELPYFQTILPVPAHVEHLTRTGKMYMTGASWRGTKDELFGYEGILANFEEALDSNIGFMSSFWTATKVWLPALGATQEYVTGCSIRDLDVMLSSNTGRWAFAWAVSAGSAMYLIDARIGEDLTHLSMSAFIRFIPNDFQFASFDADGNVAMMKLQVTEETPFEEKSWASRVPEQLNLDMPQDNLLISRPAGRIESYVGGPPKSRTNGLVFRASGLTLLELLSGNNALGEDVPPLVGNASRIFCRLSSGPMELNDVEEVRVTGLKCKATAFSDFFEELIMVPFDISVDVNQLSIHKLRAH